MCRLEPDRLLIHGLVVLLFKRILNHAQSDAEPDDKRQAVRYAVGPAFPFKAVVTLMAHDEEGNLLNDQRRAQAWAGRITNLSETGVNIQLHVSAIAHRGEACMFKLSHEDYLLEFPGTIAHFRVHQQYTSCGFSCNFPNAETRKAYFQLLEPISIGARLAPVDPAKLVQDTAGLVKEQYQGISDAMLTVWRPASSSKIYCFDFRMNAYGVRWSEGMAQVEAYGYSNQYLAGEKDAPQYARLTRSEFKDVRWLFCLAVPNLAKAVPQDVRKFLTALV